MFSIFKIAAFALFAASAMPASADTDFDNRPISGLGMALTVTEHALFMVERSGNSLALTTERLSADALSGDREARRLEDGTGPGSDLPQQSTPAQRNPLSTNLRGSSDLFLWNLVAIVNAQQVDRPFDLFETNLTVFSPAPNAVSPVPLPGALWLFGAGLLGLAAPARKRLAAAAGRSARIDLARA